MAKFKASPSKSPEESGPGPKAKRGGSGKWDGGGIPAGQDGRGPTPYKMSHSPKPGGHSLSAHTATSGRGGPGAFGKGDGFKTHAEDLEHPQSHGEFEALGTGSQ